MVQLPYVQRILVTETANHFSNEIGAEVIINAVQVKPFSGKVSIKGLSCTSFILDAKCDEVQVSGWDVLKNYGQIKSANFSNLSWDVLGNYTGSAQKISLNGIDLDHLTIDNAEISRLKTSTGGYGPDLLNIESFKTKIVYNGSLWLGIDTLVADNINANGRIQLNDDNSIEALLNLDAYPEHYVDNLGVKLGRVKGQIIFIDSTIYMKNLRSSEGHFIEEGDFKIDFSEWEIVGSTLLEGMSINIDSKGTLTEAEGQAQIEEIGSFDFDIQVRDSEYEASIFSNSIMTNGIQINDVWADINGDTSFENCNLHFDSKEVNAETTLNIKDLLKGKYSTTGLAQIKDAFFLSIIADKNVETGNLTSVDWDISDDRYYVHFISNHLNLNGLIINGFEYEGDIKNISGHVSCDEVIILNNGRSSRLVSSIETMISNEDKLRVYTTWKSSKGVDGEFAAIGDFHDELDLKFSMITEPLSEDQTLGWFGIPLETEAIEVDGTLRGTLTQPKISLNTHSSNLKISGESIEDYQVNVVHNDGENRISAKLMGLGEKQTGFISVLGSFNPQSLDLTSTINDLPLSYFNPFLEKSTVILDGEINGSFSIDGALKNPRVSGKGHLNETSVQVDYMGTKYNLSGDFNVEHDAIELNRLIIDDGKGGEGFLVGTILHDQFKDWNIDLSLSAEETPIEIMNIIYSPERYFYGTVDGTGDINIFGHDNKIVIEANLVTSKGTDFVLPMDVVSSSSWASFVEIKDDIETEANNTQKDISKKQGTIINLDINLEVNPNSRSRIVFNSELGDEITGRCKGHLHLDLHDLERLEMFGDLEIVEGNYDFNLKNIISKQFEAIPGGTIRWFGDPYNAHVDISTLYKTRATLRPILPEITDASKYNIELGLDLRGELMRPDILFDISVPEASSQYRASLASIFSNEEELNRQSVSLLVINSFLPSTWHASAVGSTGIQESSSELIAAQIGHWLSSISDDVNVGIEYDSSANNRDETAIAVALSTQLFNDRLHVEGEVGTQNLYTSTTDDLQIQDVNIKYDLKEDGSVQLTGYSTQKATVPGLEGESVQGVGVLFNKDFESIKDLFKHKSKK